MNEPDVRPSQALRDEELFMLFVNGEETNTALAYIPEAPYQFLGLPQYETERILAEHLATFGMTIRRGVELHGAQFARAT